MVDVVFCQVHLYLYIRSLRDRLLNSRSATAMAPSVPILLPFRFRYTRFLQDLSTSHSSFTFTMSLPLFYHIVYLFTSRFNVCRRWASLRREYSGEMSFKQLKLKSMWSMLFASTQSHRISKSSSLKRELKWLAELPGYIMLSPYVSKAFSKVAKTGCYLRLHKSK